MEDAITTRRLILTPQWPLTTNQPLLFYYHLFIRPLLLKWESYGLDIDRS